MRTSTRIIALLLFGLTATCTRPYNTANTILESTAVAMAETDEVIAERMVPDHVAARADVVAQATQDRQSYRECVDQGATDCGPEPTIELYMARYLAQVARWEEVTVAHEAVREALIAAQHSAIIWRNARELPASWNHACEDLHEALTSLINMLRVVGIDVPHAFETALHALSGLCQPANEPGDTP